MEPSTNDTPNTGFADQSQTDQTKDKNPQVDKVAQAEAQHELTGEDISDAPNPSNGDMKSGQRQIRIEQLNPPLRGFIQ